MTRKMTNKILELVDDGMLDARTALCAALCYMSEDDEEDASDDDAEQAQGVAQ